MTVKMLSLFICSAVLAIAAADYGFPQIPKLVIKQAGPSREYRWVGYTHHYPRSLPPPRLLQKWHPMHGTYSAIWVPNKPGGVITKGRQNVKGHIRDFGPPKVSSVVKGAYNAASAPVPIPAPPPIPVSNYQEPAVAAAVPLPSVSNIVDTDSSEEETAAAVFVVDLPSDQYESPSGASPVVSNVPVVPLIRAPVSAPLPLENEASAISNAISPNSDSSYTSLKRDADSN